MSFKDLDAVRLFALAYPERWYLVLGIASLLVSSSVNLVVPNIAGRVIDSILQDGFESLTNNVIVLCFVLTVVSFFALMRATLFTIGGERIVARLRKDVFASITKQEIAFFDKNRTGDLVNRLSSDCVCLCVFF